MELILPFLNIMIGQFYGSLKARTNHLLKRLNIASWNHSQIEVFSFFRGSVVYSNND